MDTKLTWKPHIEEIRRNFMKTITAIGCLGNSTWCIGLDGTRLIYRGVAIPQMLYACSVWSNANIRGKGYTNKTLDMLQAMQARAARVISGAFTATSRLALNIETYLLPAKQQIWKHNAETIGRVLSSQYIPELEEYKSDTQGRQKYTSPIKRIYREMEKKERTDQPSSRNNTSISHTPWWTGLTTRVGEDAAQAEKEHEREFESGRNTIRIYTDGAASTATLVERLTARTATRTQKRKGDNLHRQPGGYQIGSQTTRETRSVPPQDNRTTYPGPPGGRPTRGNPMDPAHRGIPGNEEADQAANKMTG
ncbi:hypothetical protein HD806DRAFT_532179 [Xylariaceae sp. AK1471]|nr:hypothetical protein HD806DRAFT_532179 [Xylariaceae sp. AK1471]